MPTFDKLTPVAHHATDQEADTRSVLASKLTSNAPKAEVVATFRTWLEREAAAAPWQVLMQRLAEGDDPDTALAAAESYARDQLRDVRNLATGSPILLAAATAEQDGFRAFLAAKPTTITIEEPTMPAKTNTPAPAEDLPDPLPITTYGGGEDQPGLYDVLIGRQDSWGEIQARLIAQVGDEAKALRIWNQAEAEVLEMMQIENHRTELYAALVEIATQAGKAYEVLIRLMGDLHDVEYVEGDGEHVASFLIGIQRDAAAASALLPTDEHGEVK